MRGKTFYSRAHLPYILVILVADSYEVIDCTGVQYAGRERIFMHCKQRFPNLVFQLLIYRPGDHHGWNARGSQHINDAQFRSLGCVSGKENVQHVRIDRRGIHLSFEYQRKGALVGARFDQPTEVIKCFASFKQTVAHQVPAGVRYLLIVGPDTTL